MLLVDMSPAFRQELEFKGDVLYISFSQLFLCEEHLLQYCSGFLTAETKFYPM